MCGACEGTSAPPDLAAEQTDVLLLAVRESRDANVRYRELSAPVTSDVRYPAHLKADRSTCGGDALVLGVGDEVRGLDELALGQRCR